MIDPKRLILPSLLNVMVCTFATEIILVPNNPNLYLFPFCSIIFISVACLLNTIVIDWFSAIAFDFIYSNWVIIFFTFNSLSIKSNLVFV